MAWCIHHFTEYAFSKYLYTTFAMA